MGAWDCKLRCVWGSSTPEVFLGRVETVPIDIENLNLLEGPFEDSEGALAEARAAGWEGFTDYDRGIEAPYGEERAFARVRLWRRASEAEVAACAELLAKRAAENERTQLERDRAELERLKAKLGVS